MQQAIPVNNDILKWARETSGLSVPDVARKLKKPIEIIKNWEDGILTPTYPQLERLAYDVYKRPAAVFFFPSVPHESSPKAEFRTLPEEIVDSMPPEIIRIYKRAKIYQLNLKEIDIQNKEKKTNLLDSFTFSNNSNIITFAKSIRELLNISIQNQISWKNKDEAIEEWRNVLISYGIYIFKDAFKNNLYSGLSIYDNEYPIILINNSMPKARQIFTIFHEIGHLLYKAGGIDVLQESFYNRLNSNYYIIEQKCNEFAGEFLLPSDVFKNDNLAFNEDNIIKLADTYKVSREVVLRKFLNLKIITSEIYNSYTEKWLKEYSDQRKRKKNDDSRGNIYYNKISYLGKYYINLAFSQFYQGKINAETLADYLGIKVGDLPTFESYTLR